MGSFISGLLSWQSQHQSVKAAAQLQYKHARGLWIESLPRTRIRPLWMNWPKARTLH